MSNTKMTTFESIRVNAFYNSLGYGKARKEATAANVRTAHEDSAAALKAAGYNYTSKGWVDSSGVLV